MVYKRFYIKIIVQVILISLTPLLFLYVYPMEHMLVTTYSIVALWVFQIAYLVYFINQTNRDLSRFFNAFRYQDSTLAFNEKMEDPAFENLHKSFNRIINAFGKVKIEKEKDFVFFRNTVELVGIGLLAFDSKGKVRLCNRAFENMFGVQDFKNINDLISIEKDFPLYLKELQSDRQKVKKFLVQNQILKIAVKAVSFKLEYEELKLIAFQDIKNAIDAGEMEAMHKLIRIFTHEILNSVSPISLLSTGLINLYTKDQTIEKSTIENTVKGLETIRKRSKGLISFVDEYKSLTQLPQPKFECFPIRRLLTDIEMLFQEELKQQKVNLCISLPNENQELIADEELISQVLINLIRNSIQAMKGQEEKNLSITIGESNPVSLIQIKDNGSGISDEVVEHIFTPFFTTKEKGSGIGLNLSRQIMRMHEGNISVSSQMGVATEFTLQF
jgi:nitrogen fixation/metabolism regulation signal transduction histidine kinase